MGDTAAAGTHFLLWGPREGVEAVQQLLAHPRLEEAPVQRQEPVVLAEPPLPKLQLQGHRVLCVGLGWEGGFVQTDRQRERRRRKETQIRALCEGDGARVQLHQVGKECQGDQAVVRVVAQGVSLQGEFFEELRVLDLCRGRVMSEKRWEETNEREERKRGE